MGGFYGHNSTSQQRDDRTFKEAEQRERVNPRDIPKLLKELKELVDADVISKGEFEAKKKDLLERL